jgi:hypothetical protein
VLRGLEAPGVYLESLSRNSRRIYFVAEVDDRRVLVVAGKSPDDRFEGETLEHEKLSIQIVETDSKAAAALREIFAFTRPAPVADSAATIGLGDRLGVASPGHIRLIREYPAKAILAQQSTRELNLTGRTYRDVVDAATWAVFQEGYRTGYGADGDHLKSFEEIEHVLECGASMITLDCSEHIESDAAEWDEDKVNTEYEKIDESVREAFEKRYLGTVFDLKGVDGQQYEIEFEPLELRQCVLIYHKALAFTGEVYGKMQKALDGRKIDFEMSIDETTTPTTPTQHYFVANELKEAGVACQSLAPRFCGEFQKGIDYIGDLEQFEDEFQVHAAVANTFDYKISVHSGSDKFSAFPIVGKYTGGRFHVKTAGTNWLEAVRTIAEVDPDLYRRMHTVALDGFEEATSYYHVTTDLNKVPSLEETSDEKLPTMMDQNEARQLLHITYGILLDPRRDESLREDIYSTLHAAYDRYVDNLCRHIGRHLESLGVERKS